MTFGPGGHKKKDGPIRGYKFAVGPRLRASSFLYSISTFKLKKGDPSSDRVLRGTMHYRTIYYGEFTVIDCDNNIYICIIVFSI